MWFSLLATGLGTRSYIEQALVHHRIHRANTSGWIASRADRQHSFWRELIRRPTDIDVMLDLFIREWNAAWIDVFLDTLAGNTALERKQAARFAKGLERRRARLG
jgi:hypothetical protein